jgi:hypothetical protein
MVKVNPLRKNNSRDRAPRVTAKFPVHVSDSTKGLTQDISATGISLELDEQQEPGSKIFFWVELNTSGTKMKLVCEAEVVRVEQENGKTKVATKIISQELQAINE